MPVGGARLKPQIRTSATRGMHPRRPSYSRSTLGVKTHDATRRGEHQLAGRPQSDVDAPHARRTSRNLAQSRAISRNLAVGRGEGGSAGRRCIAGGHGGARRRHRRKCRCAEGTPVKPAFVACPPGDRPTIPNANHHHLSASRRGGGACGHTALGTCTHTSHARPDFAPTTRCPLSTS